MNIGRTGLARPIYLRVGAAEAAFDLNHLEVRSDVLNDDFDSLNLLLLDCRFLRLHYQTPSKASHLRDFRRD